MFVHRVLLPGLFALAAVSTGCQQATAEDPAPNAAVIFVRVLEVNDAGYRMIAQTTPAPDAIFNIITPSRSLTAGQTLTCEPMAEGILRCEDLVMNYMGCYRPEAVEQPPILSATYQGVVHAAVR